MGWMDVRKAGARQRLGGRCPRPLSATTVSMAAIVLVAGCGASSTMRVSNRTQATLLVLAGSSAFVVGPCSERSVENTAGVPGRDSQGRPLVEPAPTGAVSVRIPGEVLGAGPDGGGSASVLVTDDYVGYVLAAEPPSRFAGTGTFPPDPSSVACAGLPPPTTPGSAP